MFSVMYLLKGTFGTLAISAVAMVGGAFIGILTGLAHTSTSRLLRLVAHAYSMSIRGVPILVLLFGVFFGIPMLTGYEPSAFVAITIGFVVWTGAYTGEIVKAGIESIHKDQWDAAKAIGMNYRQQLSYIVLPQATIVIVPPATSLFIGLIKNTSLAYLLGYPELIKAGRTVMQTTLLTIPIFLVVAGIYFMICFPLSRLAQKWERRGLNVTYRSDY